MIIQTISDRRNMTYKYYLNQPMSMREIKMKITIAKNPQLINSLDRNKNHPLVKRYSSTPFNNNLYKSFQIISAN